MGLENQATDHFAMLPQHALVVADLAVLIGQQDEQIFLILFGFFGLLRLGEVEAAHRGQSHRLRGHLVAQVRQLLVGRAQLSLQLAQAVLVRFRPKERAHLQVLVQQRSVRGCSPFLTPETSIVRWIRQTKKESSK